MNKARTILSKDARTMLTHKTVYFLRHGESSANATRVRLGEATPLTERGRRQARKAGRRLDALTIERVIISPFVRTRETFAEIERHFGGTPVEYSPLVVERRNPSVMLGRKIEDAEMEAIWKEIGTHYHIPGWRHSDEENFEDLRERAKATLEYLEALPEKYILVVTHGMYMKMLLAHILLGEALNGRIFWDKFVPAKTVENTGLLTVEYADRYHGDGRYWKLVSWNDHAHLEGETEPLDQTGSAPPHG